jgi:hypothetical protein
MNKKNKQMLYEQFVRGEIDADGFKSAKERCDSEINRLRYNHDTLKKEAEGVTTARKTSNQLQVLGEDLENKSTLSRSLVELLVEKVQVSPGEKVTVVWKFSGLETTVVEVA